MKNESKISEIIVQFSYFMVFISVPLNKFVFMGKGITVYLAIFLSVAAVFLFFINFNKRVLTRTKTQTIVAFSLFLALVFVYKQISEITRNGHISLNIVRGEVVFILLMLISLYSSNFKVVFKPALFASLFLSMIFLKFGENYYRGVRYSIVFKSLNLVLDPNITTTGFVLFCPLLIYYTKISNSRLLNILSYLSIFSALFFTFISGSRNNLAAIIITTGIAYWIFYRPKITKVICWLTLFGLTIFILFRMGIINVGLLERMNIKSIISSGGSGRLELWAEYLSVFKSQTNILSIFFGQGFSSVFERVGMSAHNTYIDLLVDFGILGLILFMWLIVYVINSSHTEGNFYLTIIVFVALLLWAGALSALSETMFWVFLVVIFQVSTRKELI